MSLALPWSQRESSLCQPSLCKREGSPLWGDGPTRSVQGAARRRFAATTGQEADAGWGSGEALLTGTGFSLGAMECSGTGSWWRLHHLWLCPEPLHGARQRVDSRHGGHILVFPGGCQGVKLSHQKMILEFRPGDPAACPPPPVRGGGTVSRARLPPGGSRGTEVRPGPSPPHFSLPRLLREQWIRAKYERQEFTHPERQEPYSAGEAAAPVRPSVRPSGSLPPRPLEPTWGVCVRPSAPDAEPAALAPGAPRLSPSPDP